MASWYTPDKSIDSARPQSAAKLRLSANKNRAVVIFESLRWQSGGVRESKDTLEMPNLPVFCVNLTAPRGERRGGFKCFLARFLALSS